MKEEWRALERFPGYEVSNIGRVKSFKRNKESLLKHCITKQGYALVCLSVNNKKFTSYIHRLVAEAFIIRKSHLSLETAVVNHKDKNRINNSVDNLEWVTPSENIFHRDDPTSYFYFTEVEKLCNKMSVDQLKQFVKLGNMIVQ
jgi:hypothetical protein